MPRHASFTLIAMLRFAFCCVLAATLARPVARAQSGRQTATHYHAWLMYFGDHKFSERWGVHLEGQVRRADFVAAPQQGMLRTGINYHISPDVVATAGYAFIETYPYGEFPARVAFPEHRLWEQLQLRSQYGRFEVVNRLRLEQRFSKLPVAAAGGDFEPGPAVYTNRARILVRASVPFRGSAIEDHSLYLSLYDEPFISFGKNVGQNLFDQNRAYVALGYKIPKWGRFEVGYLNQLVFRASGLEVENNHTLQVGLSSTAPFRKGL